MIVFALYFKIRSMEYTDDTVIQHLLSDTAFVRWAKGKQVTDARRWENWRSENPRYASGFDEAVSLVRKFSFLNPAVSDQEVLDLWNRTFTRMTKSTGKSKTRRLYDTIIKMAAVLFVPLLAYTLWVQTDQVRWESAYSQLVDIQSDQEVTVVAPAGTRTVVDLPDGSKAWLNAGSTLTYPALFHQKERKVKIAGEAFFSIQKRDVPFIVENPGPEVKVYGTAFNINSYADEELVTVALVEGKISLMIGGEERFLSPGQVSYFHRSQKTVSVRNEKIDRYICWREGKSIFRDTPLSAILRQLQRQYNVEIRLTQPELGGYRYNATFQNENLEQILELLKLSAPVHYRYERGYLTSEGTYLKGRVTIDKK